MVFFNIQEFAKTLHLKSIYNAAKNAGKLLKIAEWAIVTRDIENAWIEKGFKEAHWTARKEVGGLAFGTAVAEGVTVGLVAAVAAPEIAGTLIIPGISVAAGATATYLYESAVDHQRNQPR